MSGGAGATPAAGRLAGFELFIRPRPAGGKPRRPPEITVLRGGLQLRLNAAAYAALGRPARVVLLCDPQARIIGLRPAPADDAAAFRVSGGGGGRTVAAARFTRHYGIAAPRPLRLPAYRVGDALAADLPSPV